MSTHTIRLHRVLRTAPEKVYRAFLEGDAMCKWLPPYGFTGTMHHLEPKVGGTFKMSFTNFTTSKSHSFGGEFLELVPHERIRYTDKFDDPNLPGIIQVTVTLKPVAFGTELHVVQEGVPAVIPAEACYLGWQESLAQLAKLVEPDIPDEMSPVFPAAKRRSTIAARNPAAAPRPTDESKGEETVVGPKRSNWKNAHLR
jgi:uncharacterized protein YndB with AHSA1/START domain